MNRRTVLRLALSAVVPPTVIGRAAASQETPPGYTVSGLPLPQPDGTDRIVGAVAVAINASGDVAGDVEGATGTDYPAFALSWRKGKPTYLGAKGEIGSANDINKGRRAVGYTRADVKAATTTAVVWMKGEATPLKRLGGDSSVAFAINDKNAIVGWSTTAASGDPAKRVHACRWSKDAVTDLGSLGGDDGESFATDVNTDGQIVGAANPVSGSLTPGVGIVDVVTGVGSGAHAVRWDGDSITDLGTLGGDGSVATGINDAGQIVGTSRLEDGFNRAFLWEKDELTNLGVLPEGGDSSYGADVNGAGQVVGLVEGYGTYGRVAFLWQNGTMIDLNTLIPADGGWTLLGAWAVNDAGQIVGFGMGPDGQQVFLLTPVA